MKLKQNSTRKLKHKTQTYTRQHHTINRSQNAHTYCLIKDTPKTMTKPSHTTSHNKSPTTHATSFKHTGTLQCTTRQRIQHHTAHCTKKHTHNHSNRIAYKTHQPIQHHTKHNATHTNTLDRHTNTPDMIISKDNPHNITQHITHKTHDHL